MSIRLKVIAGPLEGRLYEFTGHGTFVVGRSREAQFSLPDDEYLSRLHYMIEVNPPQAMLIDLDSHNGSKVNGTRTQKSNLRHGDIIKTGITKIKVEFDAQDQAEAESYQSQLISNPFATGGFFGSSIDAEPVNSTVTLRYPLLGQTLGNYRLLQPLGTGGMGSVYQAVHQETGVAVALKVLNASGLASAQGDQRFRREIAIVKQLQHPNLIQYFDDGNHQGQHYFAMEYVERGDLKTIIDQAITTGKLLSIERVLGYAQGLCAGLQAAHGAGFIHRDIKPSNLMITEQDIVKITDFGLARTYLESPQAGLSLSGEAQGTPELMAPEQLSDFKNVTPAADQYSAAATLFYALTGQYPHGRQQNLAQLYRQILTGKPQEMTQTRPDIPERVVNAIQRALQRDPKARFNSVAAFAVALGVSTSIAE